MTSRVHRPFREKELIVASHNPGKAREMAALLARFGVTPISAADLSLDEPEETGTTFLANAELKALAAARTAGRPALGDDSGFCVPALGGDPGVYSARWAGPNKDFAAAMARVYALLEARRTPEEERTAFFISALTLAWPDGHTETFEGRIEGHIAWPPRGDKGFGYDPMFIPEGFDKTFGELEADIKHDISHRSRAFNKLITACFDV